MELKIDHNSPLPLHFQVENALRELIRDEAHPSGSYIPNETEIASLLGVSRHTVRHSIGKLVGEGLLVRKQGVGTKICTKRFTTNLQNWMSFTQEMTNKGVAVKNFRISAEMVSADEEVAMAFEIETGKEVVRLTRLRGDQAGPFILSVSYLHPRIGVTLDVDFNRPLYEILEQDFSVVADLSREEIRAGAADQLIADTLQVEEHAPVLERIRIVYDPGMRPVEYSRVLYRADRFSYELDIKREY
ncbi:MAG: GntR family transcriptional regulator [Bacteroidota bacterium]